MRLLKVLPYLFISTFILFFCCKSPHAYADGNIEPYSDTPLTLKMFIIYYDNVYTIADRAGKSMEIDYSSRDSLYISSMGFEALLGNAGIHYDVSMYNFGPISLSKKINISASYINQYFGMEAFYTREDTYHLYDMMDDDQGYNLRVELGYYEEPEIDTRDYGINFYLIFSSDFSYKATFKQSEKQAKSAGAFMMKFSPSITKLDADRSLIPENQRIFYGAEGLLQHLEYNVLSASAGYAYNLTSSGWFVAPYGFIGRELQHVESAASNDISENQRWENVYQYGIVAGYNESDSILCLRYQRDWKTSGLDNTIIKIDKTVVQFIVGYRM